MHASERRRRLLEAALEAFSRKGFDGATTREIAAAAGVTEAIIFRHFPSKLALYTAVLDSWAKSSELQDWLAEVKRHMERNDDAGLFRTIASCTLESYRKDVRFHRLLLFAALEGHEIGLAHNRAIALPIFELLRDYIVRRQAEGAIRAGDPGIILAAIAGMAKHYAMMTQMFGFEVLDLSDEQVAECFTRILLNGICLVSEGMP
jgi:TetR/AcrR family transcriptional regulator